ncbi:MAG TPA: phosphatase PAP2 family protein [Dissulfurispiraceae bacterium]|nr:phosphatase PAP2 family protein [Dissulfurispiraceae bacterium]
MSWLLKLRPADALNVVFSFFLLVLTVIYSDVIPSAGYLALLYTSIIFFQITLVYLGRINSFLALTRDTIFPVLCVLIIFDSLGMIVHNINPHDVDYLLIRIDYRIFGGYPTVFLERLITPLLTDVLQVAYSTYYFLPIIFGITLRVKGKREAFEKSLFLILLCFYLSYVGYLLFPAVGPRYAMQHLYDKELDGFLVSVPIQKALNLLEGVKRDAFPSGHTGVALTVLILAYRYERTLFWWMIVPVVLLVFATVYCRYHYVIDVLCGFVLTVVTFAAGEVYYKVWLRKGVLQKLQILGG